MQPNHSRIVKGLTATAVVVSVAVFLLPAAAALVPQVSGHLADIRWGWLAIAFGLTLVYWPLQACVWNLVLKSLGYSLPAGTAARIWLTTQACRWLPGGVWHYGSRTVHAVGHGIPSPIAVASMALELLLTILTWGMVGVWGLLWYGHRQNGFEQLLSECKHEAAVVGGGLLILLSVAWLSRRLFPRRLQSLRERIASLRAARLSWRHVALCCLVYAAMAVLSGTAFYAVLNSVAPERAVPFWAAVSINAMAWLVGLFAIMAPSGLVVREATLTLQLSLWMPPAQAVIIAVLWRLVQLIVEPICVAIACVPQANSWGSSRPKPATPWASLAPLETNSSK